MYFNVLSENSREITYIQYENRPFNKNSINVDIHIKKFNNLKYYFARRALLYILKILDVELKRVITFLDMQINKFNTIFDVI